MRGSVAAIVRLWLRVRNVRRGAPAFGFIAVVTSFFAGKMVPAPLGFLDPSPLQIPIGSIAPAATAILAGYLLQFQLPDLERASSRPIAALDAALLTGHSLVLLGPAIVFAFDRDMAPVFAACRVHVFALWATILGAQFLSARLSVVAVTLALLLAPTLLPSHLRGDPPGVFVTLARGESWEAASITALMMVVGVGSVLWRGLPHTP